MNCNVLSDCTLRTCRELVEEAGGMWSEMIEIEL